jgi:hypothetical protein
VKNFVKFNTTVGKFDVTLNIRIRDDIWKANLGSSFCTLNITFGHGINLSGS